MTGLDLDAVCQRHTIALAEVGQGWQAGIGSPGSIYITCCRWDATKSGAIAATLAARYHIIAVQISRTEWVAAGRARVWRRIDRDITGDTAIDVVVRMADRLAGFAT